MKHIHQHPDGVIYLRTDRGIYMATPTEFEQDYGSPFPALPDGFTERYYRPGEKHNVQNARGVEGQPMPWSEGDAILAAIDDLLAKQTAREHPPLTPAQQKAMRNAQRQGAINRLEVGNLRALREALLAVLPAGPEHARLQKIEDDIKAERDQIEP